MPFIVLGRVPVTKTKVEVWYLILWLAAEAGNSIKYSIFSAKRKITKKRSKDSLGFLEKKHIPLNKNKEDDQSFF